MRKKVISVVTALGLLASSMPVALAATSRYHTTKTDSDGEKYYVDSYQNKVYDDYVIDENGKKYYRYSDAVEFDDKDNAVIDVQAYNSSYNNSSYWTDQFQTNGNEELYDYLEYLSDHLNIDIAPENLYSYMTDHTRTCTEIRCRTGFAMYQDYFRNLTSNNSNNYNYNNNYEYLQQPNQPQYNNGQQINPNDQYNNQYNIQYNNQYSNQYTTQYEVFYTLVKTVNGKTVYAYSNDKDVTKYGIYGWTCNSVYNNNDLSLNSVFYEEMNSFGNYLYNGYTASAINSNTDMYVWTYSVNGQNYWCVSPTQDPSEINNQIAPYTNVRFYLVSEYNMNDVNVALKTSASALKALGFTTEMNVSQVQNQSPIRIYGYNN